MKNLPAILRHNTILTNWSGYPAGSLERAKALGIEVFSRSNSLEATIDLWRTECEVVEREKPWLPLGLKNKEQYILAVTGKTEKAIQRKISKTQAILQRREQHPNETQQQTADAVGCSQGFVAQIISQSSESEKKVIIPLWVTHKDQQAAFRKLPAEERKRLEALPAEKRRGAVRRAAIAAGLIRIPSVLEQLKKLWVKASVSERRQFLSEVACP